MDYFNGKQLTGMDLVSNANFDVPVNLTDSIVHVPTDVYDYGMLLYISGADIKVEGGGEQTLLFKA